MKLTSILTTLALICSLQLWGQTATITVGDTQRSYNVYAPENLGEKRPLLIFCHGYNQDANWMQNSEFKNDKVSMEAVCDTAKFVVVFPNGIGKAWDISGDRDINFIKAIIDKMATQYKIDRNRVYLGGFSMGGMLTYHAMNKIPDLIAAFAPCSGYPMGGATANANVRPIPILHIHGTGDETCGFSGAQPALNVWINHNGCPTTAKVQNNYNGFDAKMHTWGPGNNGVEVKLLELAGKGHWICKEEKVYTGREIWNFCKRFSLELKDPTVKITSPKDGLSFITFGGASEVPAMTMKATASDPDGQVVKVAFYDGNKLLQEFTQEPYSFQLKDLGKGVHQLRAVVTDDEGRTGSNSIVLNVEEPASNFVITKSFTAEGSVPTGWVTFDGNDKRVGYSDGFNQGSRVFHFTGAQHDFEWGLYTRNVNGQERAGFARYAAKESSVTLTLHPGHYEIMHRLANWNKPDFSPVRIAVETIDGQIVCEDTITPTANIGNAASNSFTGVTLGSYTFDIQQSGRYQITFYTADEGWADLVVGVASIRRKGALSGIQETVSRESVRSSCHDLLGRQLLGRPAKGLYIVNGRKMLVR